MGHRTQYVNSRGATAPPPGYRPGRRNGWLKPRPTYHHTTPIPPESPDMSNAEFFSPANFEGGSPDYLLAYQGFSPAYDYAIAALCARAGTITDFAWAAALNDTTLGASLTLDDPNAGAIHTFTIPAGLLLYQESGLAIPISAGQALRFTLQNNDPPASAFINKPRVAINIRPTAY